MAFFDDRQFLLSHVRHSFITCDDSGICEMALLNEIMPHHLPGDLDGPRLDSYCVQVKSELEPAHSLEIISDMDMIGAHRRRSNTAQRLEKLKKERRSQAKIKVIQWKDTTNTSNDQLSDSELDDLFPQKVMDPKSSDAKAALKSVLSAQIEKFPTFPNNPFNEFCRFDGRVSEGAPVKRIAIFLTMLAKPDCDYPMDVVCVTNGTQVKDLIGLCCWQYTNEGREPKLAADVNRYSLRIAEENGDVDPDFPSLNPKEPVAKFGFPVLALVEKEADELEPSLVITVHIDEMFSKFDAPNLQVNLFWVRDQALKRRRVSDLETGQLEPKNDPGNILDLSTQLADTDVREFRLVREGDQVDGSTATEVIEPPDLFPIKATLFESYKVFVRQRLASTEASLGVSGQKIDVNPLPNRRSSKIFSKTVKPVSFPVDDIIDFDFKRKGDTEQCRFKITYQAEPEAETLKFETDSVTFDQIVKQISYILKMRTSKARFDRQKSHTLPKKFTRNPSLNFF